MAVKFVLLTKLSLGLYNMSSRVVSANFFQTRSDDVIADCMDNFNCLPVAEAISRRRRNFLLKLSRSDNFLCHICRSFAHIEL